MSQNEEIIYAPIEIESADQLHALGAIWNDCRTWKIGQKSVVVYLVPASQEVRDFLVQELRAKYLTQMHENRCKVRGKNEKLISCPLTNSCQKCPYGYQPEDRQGNRISLDQMQEDGYEPGTGDTTAERGEASALMDQILKRLQEKNPSYLSAIRMLAEGYSVSEIARVHYRSTQTIYHWLDDIHRIAKKQSAVETGFRARMFSRI